MTSFYISVYSHFKIVHSVKFSFSLIYDRQVENLKADNGIVSEPEVSSGKCQFDILIILRDFKTFY